MTTPAKPQEFSNRPVGSAAEPCPLANLRVKVSRWDNQPLTISVPISINGAKQVTKSQAAGTPHEEFLHLQPGEWGVFIPHEGDFARQYAKAPAQTINLPGSKTTELPIVVTALGSLRVTVKRSDDGKVISNATVRLGEETERTVVTGASGLGGFAGVAPGRYSVSLTFSQEDTGRFEPPPPAETVTVDPGKATEHTITVAPLARLQIKAFAVVTKNKQSSERYFPTAKVKLTGPKPVTELRFDPGSGVRDFGFVQAGEYEATVELSTEDGKTFTAPERHRIAISPGADRTEDIPIKAREYWIEIQLRDEYGDPVVGEKFKLVGLDGAVLEEGKTGADGKTRIDRLTAAQCKIVYPGRDRATWSFGALAK